MRHSLAVRTGGIEEGVRRNLDLRTAEVEGLHIEDLRTVLGEELHTEAEEEELHSHLRSLRRMGVAVEEHCSRLAGSIPSLIRHSWGSDHSQKKPD